MIILGLDLGFWGLDLNSLRIEEEQVITKVDFIYSRSRK